MKDIKSNSQIRYLVARMREDILSDLHVDCFIYFVMFLVSCIAGAIFGFPDIAPLSIKHYWWIVCIILFIAIGLIRHRADKYKKIYEESMKKFTEINTKQDNSYICSAYDRNRPYVENIVIDCLLCGIIIGALIFSDVIPNLLGQLDIF